VLGRGKPSEFLVNVPRCFAIPLRGVSIRDPAERLLYPTGTGREEADVDVGKEITFSDDEYDFIIKVRYTHEAVLDQRRGGSGHQAAKEAVGPVEATMRFEGRTALVTGGASGTTGSGPMGNQWHYEHNGRQMEAGELVVMDYAGSLD
jgi:hypothetical protein